MSTTIRLVGTPTEVAGPILAVRAEIVTSAPARGALAVLRLATGFIFLWAFLDRAIGLGFSTTSAAAWIQGGTPSQGFLNSPALTGPFKSFFALIASPASDVLAVLAVLAMFAVGAAGMLGVGLRVGAVAGSVVLLFMHLAEWPFTVNAASTNPLVGYHIVYALALIVIAFVSAGDTRGFGRVWKSLPLIRMHRRLI